MSEKLLTMAQVKRRELNKAYDSLVSLRSSAYTWNNLPHESLRYIEAACDLLQKAITEYNAVIREP